MDENPILEHTNAPYHRGTISDATHTQYLRNPTCGDEVTLQLRVVGETVESVWFTAAGCMVSRAAASMVCELAEGKTITELVESGQDGILSCFDFQLTPQRQQCALLAFTALKSAIESPAEKETD